VVIGRHWRGRLHAPLLAAGATVHAFDRDPDAIAAARLWPEAQGDNPRLILHPRRFSEMAEALGEARVDGMAWLDIGVSSMQLDQAGAASASRWMPARHAHGQDGPSAADFVNTADEKRSPTCSTAMARSASRAASRAPSSARAPSRRRGNWPT
jgi:16S rRNA (cytosine1402-N4)-methyltransferase